LAGGDIVAVESARDLGEAGASGVLLADADDHVERKRRPATGGAALHRGIRDSSVRSAR
jgi:hypothetical protein